MTLQFTITGKHLSVTEAMRTHAQEKVSKLPRYFDGVDQVEVILDGSVRGKVSVEIIARGKPSSVFVATQNGEDILSCIDGAVHKLERQLTKKKGIQRDHRYTETTEQT
jgi:putative sigma-54 modulation protein